MNCRSELKLLLAGVAIFAALYFMPLGQPRFDGAVRESLALTQDYAREHVLLCLLPALFIAVACAEAQVQAVIKAVRQAMVSQWGRGE